MTSLERALLTLTSTLCIGMIGIGVASAEGTFFKKKRAAAVTQTAPVQAPTPPPQPAPEPVVAAPPQPELAAPPAPTRVSGNVDQVVSLDTLMVAGQRLRLLGIRSEGGDTTGLAQWIANNDNRVVCEPSGERYRCRNPRGVDVAEIILFNGAAFADADAPAEYRQAEAQARAQRKGVWAQR